MTCFLCAPGASVSGSIRVPGDKSISHRSIMLASIADGVSNVSGFLQGEDSLNTIRAFQQLGVAIERSLVLRADLLCTIRVQVRDGAQPDVLPGSECLGVESADVAAPHESEAEF